MTASLGLWMRYGGAAGRLWFGESGREMIAHRYGAWVQRRVPASGLLPPPPSDAHLLVGEGDARQTQPMEVVANTTPGQVRSFPSERRLATASQMSLTAPRLVRSSTITMDAL
jgi:hypothetical protein